ncbi:hypothetical protein CONLIGDRAFT_699812 [Coniochaeta ligniaria NRRL 30616]|uniref:Uncharacterized protein n=1 Tax=Coniochaeta ligniaria NRRL 30616 TaxID=1408157 RepID=A0A1J7IXC3_9PEZI|nr:hypothetical protein CONLIGDRAFT_699812 [Coniochaeta ligniaria NRRL 30616]
MIPLCHYISCSRTTLQPLVHQIQRTLGRLGRPGRENLIACRDHGIVQHAAGSVKAGKNDVVARGNLGDCFEVAEMLSIELMDPVGRGRVSEELCRWERPSAAPSVGQVCFITVASGFNIGVDDAAWGSGGGDEEEVQEQMVTPGQAKTKMMERLKIICDGNSAAVERAKERLELARREADEPCRKIERGMGEVDRVQNEMDRLMGNVTFIFAWMRFNPNSALLWC